MAAEIVIAASLTCTTSTPSALAASSFSRTRDEPGAEPSLLDHAHDDERDRDQREDDPIERRAALELERFRPQVERDQGADARRR